GGTATLRLFSMVKPAGDASRTSATAGASASITSQARRRTRMDNRFVAIACPPRAREPARTMARTASAVQFGPARVGGVQLGLGLGHALAVRGHRARVLLVERRIGHGRGELRQFGLER